MAVLIRKRRIEIDVWPTLSPELAPPWHGRWLVPFARWRAEGGGLQWRPLHLAPLLEAGDDPAGVSPDFWRFELVAVRLATFTDGRVFSLARLLRERHGWRGELRATGAVLRDQLRDLERAGFDAFELPDGADAADALRAFEEIGVAYQRPANDERLPSRRAA